MHDEIEGLHIANAMLGTYGEDLALALIGCPFFPRASEVEGYVVTSAAATSTKVTIARPKVQAAQVDVSIGNVLPSNQVVEIMRAHSEHLLGLHPADLDALKAAGVMNALNLPDLMALARILRDTGLPSSEERYGALQLMFRFGLTDLHERLVRGWVRRADEPVPLDLVIKFAPYQRKDGNYTQALAALDGGIASRLKSPNQHVVMLTERTAVLLDLYDAAEDRESLSRARKTYDDACALSIPSEHLVAVGKRLEHREAELARLRR